MKLKATIKTISTCHDKKKIESKDATSELTEADVNCQEEEEEEEAVWLRGAGPTVR